MGSRCISGGRIDEFGARQRAEGFAQSARQEARMITGIHSIIYSKHADRVRDFLSKVLELESVDAGGGWPIFAAPPMELAVHPTEEQPEHELYLMCDDVNATVAKLAERGINCTAVQDRGWGLMTSVQIADGESIGLYEPRHPSPIKR
jgi:hypothetical protein